jgi:hypothetical protein
MSAPAVPLVVVAALLVAVRLVVEVVPRVLPVELLRSPSFSAATARITR